MADDSRPLPESLDELARQERVDNWRVPGQVRPAAEFAWFQTPIPQVGGQLPKRVPGTSAFQAAPQRGRRQSRPAGLDEETSPLAAPAAPELAPPEAATPPQESAVPVPPAVPPSAPAASPPATGRAAPPRAARKGRAWRWWLSGVLVVVVLATAAVLVAMMRH